MSPITLDEFKKVSLRTAKVLEVAEIAGADKLWKLRIDLGAETREIVAGIKPYYSRETLLGKSIVIVENLAPAVIRGTESRGMLLAAKSEGALAILTVDGDLPAGSLIS